MVAFTCNICGAYNEVEKFATEPASCACGSNVRLRALMHLLSLELFGRSLSLVEYPQLKAIRGLGMTDKECYARRLAERFDYTNTHYDREPRFDFTEAHPQIAGMYDFIISADVIEHIAPPVERALEEMCLLLGPRGFLAVSVYCNPADRFREHFPELCEYRVVPLGGSPVLINRRRDGALEIREDLVFHGGSGATLEMREFGMTELTARLRAAGFCEVHYLTENVPEIGVLFDCDVSQPLIARKQPFLMNAAAQAQLVAAWRAAEARAELLAARMKASRWLRLGKRLGLGPEQ
jgi:hypothetical protein